MIVCGNCGSRQDEGTAFCGTCGVFLEWEGERVEPTAPTEQPGSPTPPAVTPTGECTEAPAAPAAAAVPETSSSTGGTAGTTTAPAPRRPGDSPSARQPDEIRRRRPVSRQVEADLPTGALICGDCGTPNESTRRFCGRCGHSLAEAQVVRRAPWWRRLLGRERVYAAGMRPVSQRRSRRNRRLLRVAVVLVVTALLLTAVALAAGTQRHRVVAAYTWARELLLPPVQVRPVQTSATVHANGHNSGRAFDGATTTFWAAPPPRRRDAAVPAVTAELAEPTDLVAIGVTPGTSTKTPEFVAGPRPTRIEVSVEQAGTADQQADPVVHRFRLEDVAEFQQFELEVAEARRVQVAVLDSVGPQRTFGAALVEIELFARR